MGDMYLNRSGKGTINRNINTVDSDGGTIREGVLQSLIYIGKVSLNMKHLSKGM